MLRARAVLDLLLEVASLRQSVPDEESEDPFGDAHLALRRAGRRAQLVAAVCGLGLAFLLATRSRAFFDFSGQEAVFSVAALVVAGFAGFRLGQAEKYRAVERARRELARWDQGPR